MLVSNLWWQDKRTKIATNQLHLPVAYIFCIKLNQRNYAHKLIQINLSHDIWNCIKTLPTNKSEFRKVSWIEFSCNICITTQDITYCFLSQLCVTLCAKILNRIKVYVIFSMLIQFKHLRTKKNGTVGYWVITIQRTKKKSFQMNGDNSRTSLLKGNKLMIIY